MALPEALTSSVLADFKQWTYESDFGGHEGTFYTCNATQELNEEIGDLEQRILSLEVRCAAACFAWIHLVTPRTL